MNALVLQIKNLIIASPDSAFTSDTVIFHVYINDNGLWETCGLIKEVYFCMCQTKLQLPPFHKFSSRYSVHAGTGGSPA